MSGCRRPCRRKSWRWSQPTAPWTATGWPGRTISAAAGSGIWAGTPITPCACFAGAGAASGTGRSTRRWWWPGPWGPSRPLWSISATAASANMSPAWTATPAWRPRNWPRRGGAPFRENLFFRPFFSFFHLYFIRRGFLEGAPGYTLAVLMSMYKFLKYYYLRELTRGRDLRWPLTPPPASPPGWNWRRMWKWGQG